MSNPWKQVAYLSFITWVIFWPYFLGSFTFDLQNKCSLRCFAVFFFLSFFLSYLFLFFLVTLFVHAHLVTDKNYKIKKSFGNYCIFFISYFFNLNVWRNKISNNQFFLEYIYTKITINIELKKENKSFVIKVKKHILLKF